MSPERIQIVVTLRLPRELLKEIDQHLDINPREGSRSEFIRMALKQYLDKQKK
jgi:metal-responsive CopG/Arc/MetJ family transcriptional regulator